MHTKWHTNYKPAAPPVQPTPEDSPKASALHHLGWLSAQASANTVSPFGLISCLESTDCDLFRVCMYSSQMWWVVWLLQTTTPLRPTLRPHPLPLCTTLLNTGHYCLRASLMQPSPAWHLTSSLCLVSPFQLPLRSFHLLIYVLFIIIYTATSVKAEHAFSCGWLTVSYLCHSLGDGSVCASTILGLWANLLGLVPEKEVVDLLCGLKKGKAT